jgi:hypothetical protein
MGTFCATVAGNMVLGTIPYLLASQICTYLIIFTSIMFTYVAHLYAYEYRD